MTAQTIGELETKKVKLEMEHKNILRQMKDPLQVEVLADELKNVVNELEETKKLITEMKKASRRVVNNDEEDETYMLEVEYWLKSRPNLCFVESDNMFRERVLITDDTGKTYGEWRKCSPTALRNGNAVLDGAKKWSYMRQVMKDKGSMYKNVIHSVKNKVPEDTLNEWNDDVLLKPVEGEVHMAFDLLMKALSGNGLEGNQKAIDYLESLVGYKYMNLFSPSLPATGWYNEGRSGKSIFTQVVLGVVFGKAYVAQDNWTNFQQFQDSLDNKMVFLIDEDTAFISMDKMKTFTGSHTISINNKYGKKYAAENSVLWFAGTQNKLGCWRYGKDHSDSRFSSIKLTTPLWDFLAHEGWIDNAGPEEGNAFITNVLIPEVYNNPTEVAKWLNRCIKKAKALDKIPGAYRDENFEELLEVQKPVWERVCEDVFIYDKNFSHIELDTLHKLITNEGKDTNSVAAENIGLNKLSAEVVEWLRKNTPSIQKYNRMQVMITKTENLRLASIKGNMTIHPEGARIQKTLFAKTRKSVYDSNNQYYLGGEYLRREPEVEDTNIISFSDFSKDKVHR